MWFIEVWNTALSWTLKTWFKFENWSPGQNSAPLVGWFWQWLNKPASKANSCRFPYHFASYPVVYWSNPVLTYKQVSSGFAQFIIFSPNYFYLSGLRFVNLCCSTHMWNLQLLLYLSWAFQQLILLPNHVKLSKLEQFSNFILGPAKHNVSHFQFDTTRCLALIHCRMKLLFWVEFHSEFLQVETQVYFYTTETK